MLRRPATTIKLSPEDILEYDESLKQKLELQQQQQQSINELSQYSPQTSILQEQIGGSSDMMQGYKQSSSINQQAGNQSRDDRIGVRKN
ncbi:uncharacterized protein J8A68_003479 [[Candida] subhashii]|uniref:Uncharacterized protein n=1 Tax=[Candida] subhashii TaxID=561895 RepID=A0A8J5QVJ4_9ASCO|nr:uncharacterized protein J8A68_003479 [[Candida] subhashii]KAG7663010.1 hypothetical protein J8A68_003479 [[Candida] subhashii]